MLANYLKVAYRHLTKHKIYTVINISGLSLGIACSVLVMLYVADEFSYDNFHSKSDRIFRITEDISLRSGISDLVTVPAQIGPSMASEFPEIESMVRIFKIPDKTKYKIKFNGKEFVEEKLFFADSTFFDIFDFQESGIGNNLDLLEPTSIIITESMSKKLFGSVFSMGQLITIDEDFGFRIGGVVKDPPQNSHFKFNFIVSIKRLKEMYSETILDDWREHLFYTYFLLNSEIANISLAEKFGDFINKYNHHGQRTSDFVKFGLQNINDIHLNSNRSNELEINSVMKYVFIFSSTALVILFSACFNFMNLSTARSSIRAKEVGVRKTTGAHRSQLIFQFMVESILMSLLAFMLALLLVQVVLPFFNSIMNRQLEIIVIGKNSVVLYLTVIGMMVGVVSGAYPSIFLSSFKPALVLKGTLSTRSTKTIFRKSLVIFQFGISAVLIISTTIILQQMEYIRNKDVGFDNQNIINVNLKNPYFKRSYRFIKNELTQHNSIIAVTGSTENPAQVLNKSTVHWEGFQLEDLPEFNYLGVDVDFLSTYGINIIAGRDFESKSQFDLNNSIILNKEAENYIDLGTQLDKNFKAYDANKNGLVNGIVENFHFASLYENIKPLVIFPVADSLFDVMSIKIRPGNEKDAVEIIEATLRKFDPMHAFEYSFLDVYFKSLYQDEERMGNVFFLFSGLAIVIACLGLYGLVSFSAEERTNEIGIRKTFGASISSIVFLLLSDFSKVIVLANILAFPAAYYIMDQWLINFAYRIEFEAYPFIFSGALTVMLSVLTILYQTIKAALANPVDALRYE